MSKSHCRLINLLLGVGVLVLIPIGAWGQTPGSESPSMPPGASPQGAAVGVGAVIVALVLVIGIGITLYERRRRGEERALVLQARISDALLLEPSLARLPIRASARMPLWRRWPPVVEITGTVPTPELREAALQLVNRERSLEGLDARTEDRIVVDPLMFKQAS
jgi:hypothetical protein